MKMLRIEVAENGFIVSECSPHRAEMGKQYAFESADTLSSFIKKWGEGQEKSDDHPSKSE